MTDAEISRRLALAIGWPKVTTHPDAVYVREFADQTPRPFDYRDPAVIWPIAERYNLFPEKIGNEWWSFLPNSDDYTHSDTAAKAVALAVIKLHREEMKDALNKCMLKPVITGTEEAK